MLYEGCMKAQDGKINKKSMEAKERTFGAPNAL